MNEILNTVITAMAAFAAGIIGSLVTLKTDKHETNRLVLSLRKAKENQEKSLAVQYITDKRVDWIYEVRNTMSEFIALANDCMYKIVTDRHEKIPDEMYRNLNIYYAKLRLLFNFSGKEDKEILELLNKIVQDVSNRERGKKDSRENLEKLTRYCQVYLKLEWERVKMETYGAVEQKRLEKLKKQYENYI